MKGRVAKNCDGASGEVERLSRCRANQSLRDARSEVSWPEVYPCFGAKLSLLYEKVAPKLREEMDRYEHRGFGDGLRIKPEKWNPIDIHLIYYYLILDSLKNKIGGARRLSDCSGRMGWPSRGVHFFRETFSGVDRRPHGVFHYPGNRPSSQIRAHSDAMASSEVEPPFQGDTMGRLAPAPTVAGAVRHSFCGNKLGSGPHLTGETHPSRSRHTH
jgi:hypothetical protein